MWNKVSCSRSDLVFSTCCNSPTAEDPWLYFYIGLTEMKLSSSWLSKYFQQFPWKQILCSQFMWTVVQYLVPLRICWGLRAQRVRWIRADDRRSSENQLKEETKGIAVNIVFCSGCWSAATHWNVCYTFLWFSGEIRRGPFDKKLPGNVLADLKKRKQRINSKSCR